MRFTYCVFCVFLIASLTQRSSAQKPQQLNSTEIYNALEKLNTLLSVLYVAAHPDDENQRIISYFSNKEHAYTSYLSLTRGDGGQNLLGTEIGPLLGVLRTHELLGARSIDGGNQYFTRAIDFGYSKHPDETFGFWNKSEVLSDVIRIIREVKPDIIINRFDHRTPGKTHGHHTASAMLSVEAFDLAGQENKYDKETGLAPWQPSKLYFNTSWWFYGGKDKFAKADKSNLTSVDIATYYPLLGQSNSEIAAYSRSMHRCQGFGNASYRGSRQEYLELLKTANDLDKTPLEGINTSWSRLTDGAPIGKAIEEIISGYDFTNPMQSLDQLLALYTDMQSISDDFWREQKLEELRLIIQSITGLFLEATTENTTIIDKDSIEIKIEATNRSQADIILQSYSLPELNTGASPNTRLELITENTWFEKAKFNNKAISNHYWLTQQSDYGSYNISDKNLIGQAISNPLISVDFELLINGVPISFTRPVTSLNILREKGEDYKPLSQVPEASLSLDSETYVFQENTPKEIRVTIEALKNSISGSLRLKASSDWQITPKTIPIQIDNKGVSQTHTFQVTPGSNAKTILQPVLDLNSNQVINTQVHTIEYDHIPLQKVVMPAKANAVEIDVVRKGKEKVAYIMGAGDQVPECLENIGYSVDLLELESLNSTDLTQYQAVLLGIRLYNVNNEIGAYQDVLFDYVKEGGNLITQYTTTWSLQVDEIAPVPLELGRGRVSDETAEVRILNANHPAMFWPNAISNQDFDGWVQERGLYFAKSFDESLEPMLSMNDVGEDEQLGSLLIMKYGEGYYVYSGLSFFRELPAGVSGAYRILANLISLGTNRK